MDFKIKKVIQTLYKINYKNCNLDDGDELITEDGVSDFTTLFKMYDMDHGIIVSPSGYEKGLCFRKIGELYNNPAWLPEIISFNLNFFGLKRNSIYKLTIIARDTGDNHIVTRDRRLVVTNSENESLINENLSGAVANKEYHTIFRAVSNETTLFFTLGKIVIKDIILDEVDIGTEAEKKELSEDEENQTEFYASKLDLQAYGIFNFTLVDESSTKRYLILSRYGGKGLNLYYDTLDRSYILERDNFEDILSESFINAPYIVEFNTTKLVNKSSFMNVITTEISNDISPNTLKQGYLKFALVNNENEKVSFKSLEGKLYILIKKLF